MAVALQEATNHQDVSDRSQMMQGMEYHESMNPREVMATYWNPETYSKLTVTDGNRDGPNYPNEDRPFHILA
jgi:hypothetical protein